MRVRIECPDGRSDSTRVLRAPGGEDLAREIPIRAAVVRMEAGKPARAELELDFVAFDGEAEAVVLMRHPATGRMAEVRAVEFADGARWEPDPPG